MREIAYAKINLGLDILGDRADGYHEVDMIMQSVSLADSLEISEADELTVTTDRAELPCDASNLAWRAAVLMGRVLRREPRVHIHIVKRIFMAAGLAGGSSDAAAVLRGLNRLWGAKLSAGELEQMAAQLGSDVPFCIRGGTVRATGRGEVLEALPDMAPFNMVLAKPAAVEVSTAWAYKRFAEAKVQQRPAFDVLLQGIRTGSNALIIEGLGNVLEAVTLPAYPVITAIKEKMLSVGAQAALMSGSGPTVIGFAADEAAAARIARALQEVPGLETAIVKTAVRSEEI